MTEVLPRSMTTGLRGGLWSTNTPVLTRHPPYSAAVTRQDATWVLTVRGHRHALGTLAVAGTMIVILGLGLFWAPGMLGTLASIALGVCAAGLAFIGLTLAESRVVLNIDPKAATVDYRREVWGRVVARRPREPIEHVLWHQIRLARYRTLLPDWKGHMLCIHTPKWFFPLCASKRRDTPPEFDGVVATREDEDGPEVSAVY